MHLLATTPGTIADGSTAVDLAQTPGDIVVLSSADSDIALLAAAQQRRRMQDPGAPIGLMGSSGWWKLVAHRAFRSRCCRVTTNPIRNWRSSPLSSLSRSAG